MSKGYKTFTAPLPILSGLPVDAGPRTHTCRIRTVLDPDKRIVGVSVDLIENVSGNVVGRFETPLDGDGLSGALHKAAVWVGQQPNVSRSRPITEKP
jgi:hypothetical protein